jgi:hypothetical protein
LTPNFREANGDDSGWDEKDRLSMKGILKITTENADYYCASDVNKTADDFAVVNKYLYKLTLLTFLLLHLKYHEFTCALAYFVFSVLYCSDKDIHKDRIQKFQNI